MKKFTVASVITMLCLVLLSASQLMAGEAMDQLQDMENTGVSFDGSDGRRSGMDIDFTDVEVSIPEPEAVPVDTE